MPVSQKTAIVLLDRMIERARDEEDRCWNKRYMGVWLAVEVDPVNQGITYHWGINQVDRRTALNVIQSYAEENSR